MTTTIVCVQRDGGEYDDPRWVRALREGVRHWAPNADFACITSSPHFAKDPWRVPPAHPEWKGKWSLVNWWQPGLFSGRVIAVGLDTLITGSLEDLFALQSNTICGISDFYQPKFLASGVMAWNADCIESRDLYETFERDAKRIMVKHPRMDPWMRQIIPYAVRLQEKLPNQIVSYKKHAQACCPLGARIVCGHGEPRFDNPRTGWAHRAWMEQL